MAGGRGAACANGAGIPLRRGGLPLGPAATTAGAGRGLSAKVKQNPSPRAARDRSDPRRCASRRPCELIREELETENQEQIEYFNCLVVVRAVAPGML